MGKHAFNPTRITESLYQIGTPSFPAYLSLGSDIMMIEGGTGPTGQLIVEQVKELGINPITIKYIALTHTHADHIGALPLLKALWPHVKVVATTVAAQTLRNPEMLKPFLAVDRSIAKIMKTKGEIAELPPAPENISFDVDWEVDEGDRIDLGNGIEWSVYRTPGHSPCHMGLFEHKEKTLVIGDTTGFYVPEKDVFWPNYFESLEKYCATIRMLASLPAQRAALSHNCVIEGTVRQHFEKALQATKRYHTEMLQRLATGEDPEVIAREKAEWVNSLTDIQPFEAMLALSKLLLKRSQKAGDKEIPFTI